MKTQPWIFALLILLVASLACSVFSGAQNVPTAPANSGGAAAATAKPLEAGSTETPVPTEPSNTGSGEYKTEFPLPGEVSNFTDLGNGAINFQTKLSPKETIAFYREAFAAAGYKEREINTAITDATFSLVFDGHASGKAIVIQGVDLGGSTNVNLRFEDL